MFCRRNSPTQDLNRTLGELEQHLSERERHLSNDGFIGCVEQLLMEIIGLDPLQGDLTPLACRVVKNLGAIEDWGSSLVWSINKLFKQLFPQEREAALASKVRIHTRADGRIEELNLLAAAWLFAKPAHLSNVCHLYYLASEEQCFQSLGDCFSSIADGSAFGGDQELSRRIEALTPLYFRLGPALQTALLQQISDEHKRDLLLLESGQWMRMLEQATKAPEVLRALMPTLLALPKPTLQLLLLDLYPGGANPNRPTLLHFAAGNAEATRLIVELIELAYHTEPIPKVFFEWQVPHYLWLSPHGTPFCEACASGDAAAVYVMLEFYERHSQNPFQDYSQLLEAVFAVQKDEVVLELLVDKIACAPSKFTPDNADCLWVSTAVRKGNIGALKRALARLEPHEVIPVLRSCCGDESVLSYAVRSGNLEMLHTLAEILGSEQMRAELLETSVAYADRHPLTLAASRESTDSLRFLMSFLNPGDVARIQALPCTYYKSLLGQAALQSSREPLELVVGALVAVAPKERAAALLSHDRGGAIFGACPGVSPREKRETLRLLGRLLEGLDPDSRFRILVSGKHYNITPMVGMVQAGLAREFARLLTEEELKAALLEPYQCRSPLAESCASPDPSCFDFILGLMRRYHPHHIGSALLGDLDNTALSNALKMSEAASQLGKILPLLDQLDVVDLAYAFGVFVNELLANSIIGNYLMGRFPELQQRLRFLVMLRGIRGRPVYVVKPWMEGDDELLKFAAAEVPKFFYEPLQKALDRTRQAMLDRVEGADRNARLQVYWQVDQLENWENGRVHICLGALRLADEQLDPLIPLFVALMKLANPELRERTSAFLVETLVHPEPFYAGLTSRLDTISHPKSPRIYLLPLQAMELAGVGRECVEGFHRYVQSNKAFLEEGHPSGQLLLDTLCRLSETRGLTGREKGELLELLASSNTKNRLEKQLRALGQILELDKTADLRSRLASGEDLDLGKMARTAFCECLGFEDRVDLEERLDSLFFSQREPSAVISYASRQARNSRTLSSCGQWVGSVMAGTDRTQRYSGQENPQLKELYKVDPSLKTVLPKLCDSMGVRTVHDLIGYVEAEESFPLSRADLYDKVITDQHLDHKRFPIIIAFLVDGELDVRDCSQEISRRTSQAQKSKGLTQDEKLVAVQELKLQKLLIEMVSAPSSARRMKLLRDAHTCSLRLTKLGRPIGEFAADLNGAVKIVNQPARQTIADYEVSLRDDYLTLFLLGTDVQGSCQRVYGSADLNRALMGYVLNGQDIPIVVRQAGGSKTEARALLRFLVDGKNQRPALFLERTYSNLRDKRVRLAIRAMAMEVASRLNYSLYTKGRDGVLRDVHLTDHGGRAPCSYSDAAGGVVLDYTLWSASCLFDPDSPAAAASSTG